MKNGSKLPHSSPRYILIYIDGRIDHGWGSYTNMGRSARAAYTYDPDIFLEEDYSAEWSAAYQQIYLYNVIANGVMDAEDGTTQKKKELLAEAGWDVHSCIFIWPNSSVNLIKKRRLQLIRCACRDKG